MTPPASTPPASPGAGPYAHSLQGRPTAEWEPLARHLTETADDAAANASPFGWAEVARTAGRLHDIGKISPEFQSYIRGNAQKGPDHASAGAVEALAAYGPPLGSLLALIVAGHHSGLPDPETLRRRLGRPLPDHAGWQAHAGTPPQKSALAPTGPPQRPNPFGAGFSRSFLVRMLFSCLVDADFIATERFMQPTLPARGNGVAIADLRDRLVEHMRNVRTRAPASPLNAIRTEILDHAERKAADPPGLFTLTVPTGGGKTLASLAFALEHAVRHGLRRVIVVIPYTAIIEQTAQVYRDAIGHPGAILEHHASFDWERQPDGDGGDERDGRGPLRRAAENWDAPIVVTTAVQFFESLFANRTSRCRKLHNIARSVVVLDEAQTMPTALLLPCMAALEELSLNYGASIVLCTATQPALRRIDEAVIERKPGGAPVNRGLDIPPARELAPRPRELYETLTRTAVEVLPGTQDDQVLADAFARAPQMLCIVNSRAHARDVFERIRGMDGAVHLTTLMCGAHRRQVLKALRGRLAEGLPVRLVSTSLIEAGVDISFPEVWRAMTGLDSIAQAAGRCNRNGELLPRLGRVVVFDPAEPGQQFAALRDAQQAARPILRDSPDPLGLQAVADYFRALYAQKGYGTLDSRQVGATRGILPALDEGGAEWRYPFEGIADAFRLIDETMLPVVVPWGDGIAHLDRLARSQGRAGPLLRALQPYTVGIPARAHADWLAAGALIPARRDLGDAVLRLKDLLPLYVPATGLDLTNPSYRTSEENIW